MCNEKGAEFLRMFVDVEAELGKNSKPDVLGPDCEMVVTAIRRYGTSNKSILGWDDGCGFVKLVKG